MQPPAVDYARLRTLCRGDAALMRDVLETLVAEAHDLLDDLRFAVTTHSGEAAKDSVRVLRGIAGNVGAWRLELLAREVESGIADHDWSVVEHAMATIAAAIEELRRSAAGLA